VPKYSWEATKCTTNSTTLTGTIPRNFKKNNNNDDGTMRVGWGPLTTLFVRLFATR